MAADAARAYEGFKDLGNHAYALLERFKLLPEMDKQTRYKYIDQAVWGVCAAARNLKGEKRIAMLWLADNPNGEDGKPKPEIIAIAKRLIVTEVIRLEQEAGTLDIMQAHVLNKIEEITGEYWA